MKKKNNHPEQAAELRQKAELRRRAEEISRADAEGPNAPLPGEGQRRAETGTITQVLDELRVHQIKLEMQNEELCQTQVELATSRARYFDLFDLAPVGYLTLNDKLLILEANLTATTMLGVERGALIKQPFSRYIFKEDQDIFYLCRKQIFETGTPQTCELRLMKKDGITFQVRLEAGITQAADGMLVYRAVLSDITEQKQTEELLHVNEEKYHNLFSEMSSGCALHEIICDNSGNPVDYVTLEVNKAYESLLEVERENVIGKRASEILPQVELQRWVNIFGPVALTGTVTHYEIYSVSNQKHFEGTAYCPESGKFAVTFSAITERKQAEEALRKSEANLSAIVESTTDRIWAVDARYRLIIGNRAFQQGISNSVGREFKPGECVLGEQFPAEARKEWQGYYDQALRGKQFHIETPLRFVPGQYWDNHFAPIRATDGQIEGVVIIAHNITARRQMEQEQDLQIEVLQLLNSKSDLHELMRLLPALLKERLGFEAVGIRLRDGLDFPYFETKGFPAEFVLAENRLCAVDRHGELCRDRQGNPMLECMCGNVICGRFDPAKPFFTAQGSFWTNSTSALLTTTTETDRQSRTRNRCNGEGYESVALIPLQARGETFGLLQVNDKRKACFTPALISLFERISRNIATGLAHRQAETALQKSEETIRALLNATTDSVALLDLNGNMLALNETMARVLGKPIDELAGQCAFDYLPPEVAAPRKARVEEVIRSGNPIRFEDERAGRIIDSSFYPAVDAQGQVARVAVFGRDVTERKQAEVALQRRNRQLELLNRAGYVFSSSLSLGPLLEMVLEEVRNLLEATACLIWLIDPVTHELVCRHVVEPQNKLMDNWHSGSGEAIAGATMIGGQSIIMPDMQADTHDIKQSEEQTGPALRSVLSVPLQVKGNSIGVLQTVDTAVNRFTDDDLTLLQSLAGSAAIAIENARLFEEIDFGHRRLRSLSKRLVETQENERRRIARELHDVIGQALTAIKISLQSARYSLGLLKPDSRLDSELNGMVETVEQTLQEVRRLSFDLRPSLLDDLGLIPALRWNLDRQAQQAGFAAQFRGNLPSRLPAYLEVACFRIAQEALTNVVRHAGAKQVSVELQQHTMELQLTVRDDGVGFEVPRAFERATAGTGLGLLGMQERAQLVGGRLEIESVPTYGTEIRLLVPLSNTEVDSRNTGEALL